MKILRHSLTNILLRVPILTQILLFAIIILKTLGIFHYSIWCDLLRVWSWVLRLIWLIWLFNLRASICICCADPGCVLIVLLWVLRIRLRSCIFIFKPFIGPRVECTFVQIALTVLVWITRCSSEGSRCFFNFARS